MDYKVILNLMKEMNHNGLTKLEIEEEGIRICMEKSANVTGQSQCVYPQVNMVPAAATVNPVGVAQPVVVQQNNVTEQPVTTDVAEKLKEELCGKKLVSPMVGTFYASPSPDKPAFIKVGDKVKKGQTVCIIEAMKLMNEIESEFDGEIVKILANNEEMVEFGQPLFLIK